jgi:hypothetical protein
MTAFRGPNRLTLLGRIVPAVMAVMALSAYATFGGKLPGFGQRSTASMTQTAPGSTVTRPPFAVASPAPAQPPAKHQPAVGVAPADPSPGLASGSGSASAAPAFRGRPNPFVPLVRPVLPSAPRAPLQHPLSPRASVPQFGIDLPLPPGFTAPAPQSATAPTPQGAMAAAPGADMAVGAIIGGRERVAIIRQREKVFVVGIGDTVGGAVVTDIKDDKVIMRSGGRTFELAFGGEAP